MHALMKPAVIRASGHTPIGLTYWESRKREMLHTSRRMERVLVLAVIASNVGALATLLI